MCADEEPLSTAEAADRLRRIRAALTRPQLARDVLEQGRLEGAADMLDLALRLLDRVEENPGTETSDADDAPGRILPFDPPSGC